MVGGAHPARRDLPGHPATLMNQAGSCCERPGVARVPGQPPRSRMEAQARFMLRCLWLVPLSGLPALLSSCGPPVPAPAEVSASTSGPGVAELDGNELLEEIERRVAESIARLRESAVALEYAAPDAPSGDRRVATGVVVNERGDVLSIRIDSPPSAVPILARDASGGRHRASWIAADAETGLTLLRIE